MYELVTGPLLWVSCIVFFVGLTWRGLWYLRGLDWKLDRVSYTSHIRYGIRGALRSIGFWIIPYGARSWRMKPLFTALVFVFHLGLLVTPVFLLAHNIWLKQAWGLSLPTLPQSAADALTVAVILCAAFLALRRLALPEVRIISTWYDYLLLAVAVAPFVTGLAAGSVSHASYRFWLVAHILSGEIWLMAVPLTKLSHFLLFFLSRAQLGVDYGVKRGGMKSRGLAW